MEAAIKEEFWDAHRERPGQSETADRPSLVRPDRADSAGGVPQIGREPIRGPASPSGKRRFQSWIEPGLILLLVLTLNIAGNSRTGLWDRDEPRYAVSVREMRQRGDWFFPTFNGEPRYHKPILIYWLMGAATAFAGDNPFGVRLVSALAGAGTVLLVWVLGRSMLGPRGGRLAAIVLATAPIMVAESKLATTDATLALWLVGCQACLWVLGKRPSRVASWSFWLLLSLAMLTKGPIGPAMILVSGLLAWWWGWTPPSLQRLNWRKGAAMFIVLVAPWFAWVTVASGGDFLRFAIGRQIVNRMASDMEAHGGFPGYYPVISALVFYPWSALVPVALLAAVMRRKSSPALAFLMGWMIGPLILLECFRTKLIHYYLPAFPAFALLLGWCVVVIESEGVNIRRWTLGRLTLALLVAIGLGGAVLFASVGILVRGGFAWPLVFLSLIIAAGTILGLSRLQRGATESAVYVLAGTWAVVLLALAGWLVPLAEPYRTSRVLGERLRALSDEMGCEPVTLEFQEPGVVYALGRPIATTRDRDGFYAHLEGGRSVLTVALPSESQVMRSHFGLRVTALERIDGLVLTKGKLETFEIVMVSAGNDASRRSASNFKDALRAAELKQPLIK
jgi:4-amino-4-deoxy-L-arabinose transferase-like glycosyltransferase